MYSKTLIQRFQGMHGANAIGYVEGKNCQDVVRLYLKVNENNNLIENARFKAFGGCATIASADVTCDLVKGKTMDEALGVTNQDVIAVLGDIPANKIHCAVMAEEAIHSAIEYYYKRKEKEAKKAISDANNNI